MPKYSNSTSYRGRKANSDHSGQAKFASDEQAAAGVADDVMISPASLASSVDDLIPDASLTVKGITEYATEAETTTGTSESLAVTPKGVNAVAIAGATDATTLTKGILELATSAETVTGTDPTRGVVPSGLTARLEAPGAIGGTTPAAGAFTTLAATGAIDFDAGGSIETGATALNVGADAGTGAINVGTGGAARAIIIGNTTAGTAVTVNTGTGHFTVNTTGAGDIILNSDDTMLLDSDGVLELNSSAGAISIGDDDVDQAINLGTDGERVITVGSTNGAAQLDFITGTGNFSLDGVTGTTYTIGASTTTGTTTIGGTAQTGTMTLGDSSGTNIVQIGSGEGATTVAIAGGATSAKVVTIADGAVANLVTIGSASGAASLDLLAGTGNFSLEGATATTYDLSATGANTGTFTIAAGTGARVVNVATGGTGVKTVNVATGAIGNIVTIGTVSAAASMSLLVGTGNFSLEGNVASTYAISNTGVNTGQVDIAGGTGARAINIGGGGTGAKTIGIGAAASADVITIGTSDGAGSLDLVCGTGNMSLEGATASTFEISSTGVNTGTCKFASGTGARIVEIAGGGTGIKTINIGSAATADVITIGTTTAGGATTIAAGTGRITLDGTVKEINAEYLFSSGTDLTITQSPIMQANANTGAVPTGVDTSINLMYLQDGCLMEQYMIGTQSVIAPRMTANGLNIALDQTAGEGFELNFGSRNNAKHVYTIGTSAAFEAEVTVYVEDVSGCEPLFFGFRKVEAEDSDYTNYTDFVGIGIDKKTSATNVTIADQLNTGGVTLTDSTDSWGGDTSAQTVKVLVSDAGVVTFEVGGSAATAAPAYTFDNTDKVMFWCSNIQEGDLSGEISLQNLKIGFQA